MQRQGAGPGWDADEREELQPGVIPGQHSPAALRPRCGTRAVAGSDCGPGRGGSAVLAQARGEGGGRVGDGADTGTVEAVFVSSMLRYWFSLIILQPVEY